MFVTGSGHVRVEMCYFGLLSQARVSHGGAAEGFCLWGNQLRETVAKTVIQRAPFLQDLLTGPSDPPTPVPPADTRPALLPVAQGQH